MIYSIAHALVHGHESLANSDRRSPFSRMRRVQIPLRLQLGGQSLEFANLDDFSFAIEARTSVPHTRFSELLARSPDELWKEADSIKQVEKRLVDILEDALCEGAPCGPAIRDLGLQIYSKDHDWRAIMEEMNRLEDTFDSYKRLALIKYMQYLGARQEILRKIFALQTQHQSESLAVDDEPSFDGSRETILFDLGKNTVLDATSPPMQRLPQGEAIRIHALPGHAVGLKLAKHPFTLTNEDGWVLCDQHGRRYPLAAGQNMIGRGSGNDVCLDKELRNVSRRHLIAEPIDDHIILLTDISSHGTYAPPMQTEHREP